VTRRGSRGDCPARSSNAHLTVHIGTGRRDQRISQVIIGVDPHKLSATVKVVDQHERLLGTGRFTTDQAGYAAMRSYAKSWPERVWAVEGANGAGRPLAQRLLEASEHVVDVPREARRPGTALRHRAQPQDRRPRRPLGCGPHGESAGAEG